MANSDKKYKLWSCRLSCFLEVKWGSGQGEQGQNLYLIWTKVNSEYACIKLHTHRPDDREDTPIHLQLLSLAA